VTFIDDHTRLSWVYLIKEKSKVEIIFKNFYTMVQTQFQKNIQILQSDNGREYFKNMLSQFFLEKGIVHQSSCVDIPQQNGLAERKNKHLLEVARALLFTNQVPKYLWGEAVLTATYLINRMPNKVLSFETPFDVFHKFYPTNRLSSSLPLKIFGCTTFVHIHSHNRGKLEP
jgi:IS30 family transposase